VVRPIVGVNGERLVINNKHPTRPNATLPLRSLTARTRSTATKVPQCACSGSEQNREEANDNETDAAVRVFIKLAIDSERIPVAHDANDGAAEHPNEQTDATVGSESHASLICV